MIIDTLDKYSFRNEFLKVREDNFSYEGLEALFEYLEQLSEDMGKDIEFDPIGFCCDFREYKNLKELQEDYPDIESIEELQNETSIIQFKEGLIIHAF